MDGAAIVAFGSEGIAKEELESFGAINTSLQRGTVLFEMKKSEDLLLLAYRLQSVDRIIIRLSSFTFSSLEDLESHALDSSISEYFSPETTFCVRCSRRGDHEFSSADCEQAIGGAVFAALKNAGLRGKVNLNTPQVIVYGCIVDNDCIIGIDVCGFDMSKRDYKIFITPVSMKGTTAFALLKFSGYEKKHTLLDPFVGDGAIVIEAALHASGKAVNYYKKEHFAFKKLIPFLGIDWDTLFASVDKKMSSEKFSIAGFEAAFKNVDYGKKNAKIAGVEKLIYLSRVESEWLDIKFDKGTVDRVITKMPEPSMKLPLSVVEKLRHELFYQAEYILKKSGKVGILCKDSSALVSHAQKFGFSIEKEQELWTGEQRLEMVVFGKKG